jgi:methionyl-tRNA formyltransferase
MKIENLKLKIVFFGTPDFVIPVLHTLNEHYDVVGVVTTPDQILGRKKVLTPSPVKQFAEKHAIPTLLTPEQLRHETTEQLQALNADIFVVAAYGKIIPKSILELPTFSSLNIHPSLLPKYRGPSPIQSAIRNGDKETGVTIIKMDEKIDHGPILMQEKVAITTEDTFQSLHHTLFKKAAEMLVPAIEGYTNGSITPSAQAHDRATYCQMITKEDGYFDIANPPDKETLDLMIKAYYPWPTAWTQVRIKNHELRIMKVLPGEMVQLEGGKPMKIKDFLNGYTDLEETLIKILNLKS